MTNGLRTKQSTYAAKQVHDFNRTNPIGTAVEFWPGVRDRYSKGKLGRTATQAQVLGGHTAVVWIEGHVGCVALTHVEPIVEAS